MRSTTFNWYVLPDTMGPVEDWGLVGPVALQSLIIVIMLY